MRNRVLVVATVVALAGCGSPPPESKQDAAPAGKPVAASKLVHSGPGIIGTWEGTETRPAPTAGTTTTPTTEQFDAEGTFSTTEDTSSIPFTSADKPRTIHSVTSGTYSYDEKAKTLKMKMLKETIDRVESTITENSSDADQVIAVNWVSKDEIAFTRGSVKFSLKRKG